MAYAAPTSINFYARRKHFIRLVSTIAIHEHRDVITVLIYAHGSHSIALSQSVAAHQKGTAAESVSHVEVRFMTSLYSMEPSIDLSSAHQHFNLQSLSAKFGNMDPKSSTNTATNRRDSSPRHGTGRHIERGRKRWRRNLSID